MRCPKIKLARGIIWDLAWVIWLLIVYSLLRRIVLWALMENPEVFLSTGILPLPPAFSCCLLTGSNFDLPENLDKGLGFQMITNHHLFFCVCAHARVFLLLGFHYHPANWNCQLLHLWVDSLWDVVCMCSQNVPTGLGTSVAHCFIYLHKIPHFLASTLPSTSLYANSLHLLKEQPTLGQWLPFVPREPQPRHADTKLLPSPNLTHWSSLTKWFS